MEAHTLVLATAGIVAANEALLSPVTGHGVQFNWRLIPATGITMLAFYGFEKVSPTMAMGLATVMLVTVLVTPLSHTNPPPLVNLANLLGYKTGKGAA